MRNSLSQLVEVCIGVKVYFSTSSFQIYYYEDGAFCEFLITKMFDPKGLLNLCRGLDVRMYHDDNGVIVRIYENYEE